MNSNFIFDGGNSLIALAFIEQIAQVDSSIEKNYLFDLVLHKNFGDIIEYITNPQQQKQQQQQQQQQEKPIEYSSSIIPPTEKVKPSLQNVLSIQRCSKAFIHHEYELINHGLYLPDDFQFTTARFTLNWKRSMLKCIDASPVIILLDEKRNYVIIGSHAGLINAYQIDNGQLIWSFQANDRIEASGVISRNGKHIIIGTY